MTRRQRVALAVLDLLRTIYVLAWLGLCEGYAAAYADDVEDDDVFDRLRSVGSA